MMQPLQSMPPPLKAENVEYLDSSISGLDLNRFVDGELAKINAREFHGLAFYHGVQYIWHGTFNKINKSLNVIFKEYGWEGVTRFFANWPDDKKKTYWFSAITHFAFRHSQASELPSFLDEITHSSGLDGAPQAVYRSILRKMLEDRAYLDFNSFKPFMDWLVQWDVYNEHPCIDLLRNIPPGLRATRPDLAHLPEMPVSIFGGNCCEQGCWGGRNNQLDKEYLGRTSHAKHSSIVALLNQVPQDYVIPLLEYWLTNPEAGPVREALFFPRQHPFSVMFTESRPWNILLPLLKRGMPLVESEHLRAMTNHRCLEPESLDPTLLRDLALDSDIIAFGRTVGFLKGSRNLYLKVQRNSESDENFIKQAARYDFFESSASHLTMKTQTAKLLSVFKAALMTDVLPMLDSGQFKKERVLAACAGETLETISEKALGYERAQEIKNNIFSFEELFDEKLDESLVSNEERTQIIRCLSHAQSTSQLMMLLETPENCRYENYVYQDAPAEAMEALADFAHDFSTLFSYGIIGMDVCSAFHDIVTERRYCFLSPFYLEPSVGTVDRWAGYSTNYPNIGCKPLVVRDAGDIKSIEEKVAESQTLLGYENNETYQKTTTMLDAMAKTVWGEVLLYGRIHREQFNHQSIDSVKKVEEDISRLLVALFSTGFKMHEMKCRYLMDQYDLLGQTARELTYYMADRFIADLNAGIIPESVYPYYRGQREGLRLCDKQKAFFEKEGTTHLGGRNGRNPIMALDALLIHMLGHGCLSLVDHTANFSV